MVEYFVNFFIILALGFCYLLVYGFLPKVIKAVRDAKYEMALTDFKVSYILP